MQVSVNQQKELEKACEVLKTVSTDYSTDQMLGANYQQVVFQPETDKSRDLLVIVLVLVPSNVTYKVETSLLLTVQALRNIIESELGIDRSSCVLLHKGEQLVDSSEEKSHRLENNSFVYIVPRTSPNDNNPITLNLQRGRTLSHVLQFKPTDKVNRIHQAVASQLGVPAQHQTLMYCGGKLPNKRLNELYIVNKSNIRLVVSQQYKKQMSKSYMFANPKPEEKPEQHLPQIEELAKDVQSIDDVDDQILKREEEQEVVSADQDYFETQQPLKKKRSYYSSKDKSTHNYDDRFCKSERPKVEEEEDTKEFRLGLIQVKEVNSVYNPDEDQFQDEGLMRKVSSAQGRNSQKCMEWDYIPEQLPQVQLIDLAIKADQY